MASEPAATRPLWQKALRFWEIPFLAVLTGWMFYIRMLPYKALVGSGRSFYIGTDPFYHYRETLGIVRAFPRVPRWDPWTFYPNGTGTGQFGSLFDWLCAAVIVLLKGKAASEADVQLILGIFPAVLGALLIVPFYFLAKKMVGKWGAVLASVTLALLPGEFLIRSVAGYSDHHVAEDFFSILSMLGVVTAVEHTHALRDRLTSWQGARREWPILLWSGLGGLALAANFYAWPPAILFLGILTLWLTVVIILENAKQNGDSIGFLVGGALAFVIAGLLTLPSVETTYLGEFNTYGILQPMLCFGSAAWLLAVHLATRWTASRRISPLVVPGVIVALIVAAFVAVETYFAQFYQSIAWGLSWITGIGIRRTTLTIVEARQAEFFCGNPDASCLTDSFGVLAVVGVFALVGLVVWALVKRRRMDILLALWSLIIFRATTTQIRFSYYLAVNLALLVGWLASRVAEATGLETPAEVREQEAAPTKQKGRKARSAIVERQRARPLQIGAVLAVLLLVFPGNVLASGNARPTWDSADIRAPDGDLVMWMRGLDWMRNNTPDAGVDLGLVVKQPPVGQLYDYPPQSYGVLSWWDYGHWIETVALRPPVANPFQQAAPFASTWFTERNAQTAETMLHDWEQGKGPVRYVYIDDEMATGKFYAITVWAHSQNDSRDVWPNGGFSTKASYQMPTGAAQTLYTTGGGYNEAMMGRLYDGDANSLEHYRLVWEDADYDIVGSVTNTAGDPVCFHDVIPSQSCRVAIQDTRAVTTYRPGTAVSIGNDQFAYDLSVQPRLKLFERVAGAHVRGAATPGATVTVETRVEPQPNGVPSRGPFDFSVSGKAGPDGTYDIIFPYSNSDPVPPSQGGTTLSAHAAQIVVSTPGSTKILTIPDRAVLHGETVNVG